MFDILHHHETTLFDNRTDAGKRLALRLEKYANDDIIILALPRGGVAIGYEIGKALDLPLDVLIARKLGSPYNPEFGIGAISEEDIKFIDTDTIKLLGIKDDDVKFIVKKEEEELARRKKIYRNNTPLPNLQNKTVFLVDDGLATGVTAMAALGTLHKLHTKRIIFTAPVCAYEKVQMLRPRVDDVVCLAYPYDLQSIGLYYHQFAQITDEEVIEKLESAKKNYKHILIH